MMKTLEEFVPGVVERSARMVPDAQDEYSSQWAAIESIAVKVGCMAETLQRWVRQAERRRCVRKGPAMAELKCVKDLERVVRALRRANELPKLASVLFAQTELGRRLRS